MRDLTIDARHFTQCVSVALCKRKQLDRGSLDNSLPPDYYSGSRTKNPVVKIGCGPAGAMSALVCTIEPRTTSGLS